MVHHGTDPVSAGWTRQYIYEGDLDSPPSRKNNQLIRTQPSGPNEGSRTDYSYDEHGNMQQVPHLPLMRWNFKDQLQTTTQQVVTSGGTPEMTYYVYDSAGHRVRKVTERQAPAGQIPTRVRERIYLGGFEIYREYDNTGDVVDLQRETLHIMDDKQRIALVETKTLKNGAAVVAPTPLVRYQFSNHLGSASLELDDQAQTISYEEYYPYGSTSYQAVRTDIEVPLKRYRFTAKERDEESGLYYHGARYYAPWLGRWVSCDPAGLGDGVNLYVYCRSSPIARIDSAGTDSGIVFNDKDIQAHPDAHVIIGQRPESIAAAAGTNTQVDTPSSAESKKVLEQSPTQKVSHREEMEDKKALHLIEYYLSTSNKDPWIAWRMSALERINNDFSELSAARAEHYLLRYAVASDNLLGRIEKMKNIDKYYLPFRNEIICKQMVQCIEDPDLEKWEDIGYKEGREHWEEKGAFSVYPETEREERALKFMLETTQKSIDILKEKPDTSFTLKMNQKVIQLYLEDELSKLSYMKDVSSQLTRGNSGHLPLLVIPKVYMKGHSFSIMPDLR